MFGSLINDREKALDAHEEVLVALRQIIRAVDLHSRKLNKDLGLTGPQLILMRAIRDLGDVTIKQLSIETNMSQATATSIIDRLEKRQLVERVRSQRDRRIVHAKLTDSGRTMLSTAPLPLQDSFIQRFYGLDTWEQTQMLSTVQRISAMMNAHDIEAEPVLHIDPDPKSNSTDSHHH